MVKLERQRKGESLVNYIRFVKKVRDDHFETDDIGPRSITSHKVVNYIYRMSDAEFNAALNYDWSKYP